jgi:hypothetical protein
MQAKADMTAAATPDDQAALLLMLAYVEAECRRLGAEAAAAHAAMAAALVPGQRPQPQPRGVH